MKKLIVGAALLALLSVSPSLAADKKMRSSDDSSAAASSSSADANAGRGGLSEWPVSKEEADWSSAAPASSSGSSTGSSSGTSGAGSQEQSSPSR